VRGEQVADHLFGGAVGLGHRRQVGLGVDDQVGRQEALARHGVRGVGEGEGQGEVGRERAHGSHATVRFMAEPGPPTAVEIAKVLRSYFAGDQLRTMPRAGRKRQIVLEYVVQVFEPGVRYPEVEVNSILRQVWSDTAALRRYLVDAGLLGRGEGAYWRTGGPVDV
jgi:hypothetical protein